MQIIISPAKSLDFETELPYVQQIIVSQKNLSNL